MSEETDMAQGSSREDLKEAVIFNCDRQLINLVQQAIIRIKNQRQQCNLSRILAYLKNNSNGNEKVSALTDKELIRQLDLAVRDGILSRKFNSANQEWKYQQMTKSQSSIIYKIPALNDKKDAENMKNSNLMLQLLIKTIAILNNQNFTDPNSITMNESTISIDDICKHMKDTYKFEDIENNDEKLVEYINYLLRKNEKIFIIKVDINETRFKLNSSYIQQKLQQNKLELNSAEINADTIYSKLGYRPPFTPEQILKIESIKSLPKPDTSCRICLNNKANETLLSCSDCAASFHIKCLKYSDRLAENTAKTKWQCIECKKCSVCLLTSNSMLLCDHCDRGYHKECCVPKISKMPKGDFVCHVCKEIKNKMAHVKEVKNDEQVKDDVNCSNHKITKNEDKKSFKRKIDFQSDEKCINENMHPGDLFFFVVVVVSSH